MMICDIQGSSLQEQHLHITEPTRKSNQMNKKRVLDEEGPNHYEKPVADSDSRDYEAGEEEVMAIADVEPHMAGGKMKNLTSRQRAILKGGKDSGKVEFPEGLPPAPPRSKNRNVIFPLGYKSGLERQVEIIFPFEKYLPD
jgi:hypothetical protein